MSTALATPIEKARQIIYRKMTESTQRVADTIGEVFTRNARAAVLNKYDIGSQIATVKGDEQLHGNNAVKLLAEYFHIPGGDTALYALMNFANRFDRAYVSTWAEKRMPSGGYLSYEHFVQIGKIETVKKQEEMLKRAISQSMSANDIETEVRSGEAGKIKKPRHGGGRPPGISNNPVVALQTTYEVANKFNNFADAAKEVLFDAINALTADKVSSELLDRLNKTRDTVVIAAEKSADMLERIDSNITRVERLLADQAKAVPADTAKAVVANAKKALVKAPAKVAPKAAPAKATKPPAIAAKAPAARTTAAPVVTGKSGATARPKAAPAAAARRVIAPRRAPVGV